MRRRGFIASVSEQTIGMMVDCGAQLCPNT
jgi:hypothetical protein